MQYCSPPRFSRLASLQAVACVAATLLSPLQASAAVTVPTDLQVVIQTRNSGSNPGPFSAGSNALLNARFRIDASVTPTGSSLGTWAGALDDLVLTVNDSVLGNFTVYGQDGQWRQLNGGFLFGGWGPAQDGSLLPFSVLNPAISATPFVLQSISFDFRGAALFTTPLDLPTGLSHLAAPGPSDFGFLDLTLSFSNSDPTVGGIPKQSIIRYSAFDAITISPVPEPQTLAMLMAGMLVVGGMARRRRR